MTRVRIESRVDRWLTRHWLRSCAAVGAGAVLHGKPTIRGGARIRIGERFQLASIPSPSHIVAGPEGTLEIGDDVSIGHGAGIAAYACVRVGSGTWIAPYVILLDTDFHAVGDRAGRGQAEPITIGCGVRIGSRVTILRGSQIGDGAVVSAGAVVSGPVAAGARVSGVPARATILLQRDAGTADTGPEIEKAVPEVVMRSLGLSGIPGPSQGPSQIAQWDSLGTLRLLLALEEAFGVILSAEEVMRVATIAGLTQVVDRAVTAKTNAESAREVGA